MRAPLRNELEAELRRLMGVWFPRCVDREHGGFLCDFDYRWKPSGSQVKMLEYQARQTLAAARGAAHAPDHSPLREAAAHGFRYLKETMWDRRMGGWYRQLDRVGAPLEGSTKHGHGMSYAISACVACYQLTRDPDCLELAKAAFSWLDRHAHDGRHGGYFGFYRQDGTPIVSADQGAAPDRHRDAIGTPIGFKDANTTCDLLRGFADLYRAWPDALLRARVEELLCIARDRLVVAPGVMHMYAHPDWTPIPDFARYAQVLRAANHMLPAAEALAGTVDRDTARVAKSMLDTMLRVAWDAEKAGFHLAGSSFGPAYIEDSVVFVRSKCWWAQAEGMRLLMAVARLHPADAVTYEEHFVRLWEYVKRYLIDARHGGWLAAGLDTNPEARKKPKATRWKDCSHEAEGLLECLPLLDAS
ncbi:MAG TPA: AGE family epimerase/isomerase [bacterium]|nr:AGE family epimerase/isomerase [bacterium]